MSGCVLSDCSIAAHSPRMMVFFSAFEQFSKHYFIAGIQKVVTCSISWLRR